MQGSLLVSSQVLSGNDESLDLSCALVDLATDIKNNNQQNEALSVGRDQERSRDHPPGRS